MENKFISTIQEEYHGFEGSSITLGTGIYDGIPQQHSEVRIPLRTLNRHGLISGATGTGKTVTLQVLAEQFSLQGIPTVLMDLKGDLSGLAASGSSNKHIVKRFSYLSEEWAPKSFPLELLSLSQGEGAKLKATVTEFGPVLMAKILDLNDTQRGILAVIFKYCDDQEIPLIDLQDLKKLLQYATEEGKEEFESEYGRIHRSSVSTILRKILELEQQGADTFFAERSFDVNDLVRHDKDGYGMISVIRLTDIKDKPKLFSTFMLSLLAEIYSTFPEVGDLDKPKLCLFIDEAHLIFSEASNELLDQVESIVKLIRSKGVGIFFCTQSPSDVPNEVLGQLGLKVQHALRAFTAKDRKDIKRISENFPITEFYETDQTLTSLGIGEAFITAINEKGIPTPLVATLLRSPQSRMGVLDQKEIETLLKSSDIRHKYNEDINRESAHEILNEKIKKAKEQEPPIQEDVSPVRGTKQVSGSDDTSLFTELSKNTMVRQIGRTVGKELIRGIFGVLGLKKR
jgi:hypothetical protein